MLDEAEARCPQSVKLWLMAAKMQQTHKRKREVLEAALRAIAELQHTEQIWLALTAVRQRGGEAAGARRGGQGGDDARCDSDAIWPPSSKLVRLRRRLGRDDASSCWRRLRLQFVAEAANLNPDSTCATPHGREGAQPEPGLYRGGAQGQRAAGQGAVGAAERHVAPPQAGPAVAGGGAARVGDGQGPGRGTGRSRCSGAMRRISSAEDLLQ